ncbi:MAG: hypothetical protein J6U50_05605 [Lachnospiraceae bacterium]|nr:hypothetical protein [Lachnospiraceae bacterium]
MLLHLLKNGSGKEMSSSLPALPGSRIIRSFLPADGKNRMQITLRAGVIFYWRFLQKLGFRRNNPTLLTENLIYMRSRRSALYLCTENDLTHLVQD